MQIEGVNIQLKELEASAPHIYMGIECFMVLRGRLNVVVGEQTHILLEDDVLVVNRGMLRTCVGEAETVLLTLRISDTFLKQHCEELVHVYFDCDSGSVSDREMFFPLKRMLTQLLFLFIKERRMLFLALLFQILALLERDFGRQKESESFDEIEGDEIRDRKILAYLNAVYAERITLKDAAQQIYMTPQAFSKFFRKRFGIGFLQYLSQIRLDHAATELLCTRHTITQVALNNGFANAKAFSKVFQKSYGMLPSVYRRIGLSAVSTDAIEKDVTRTVLERPLEFLDFTETKALFCARKVQENVEQSIAMDQTQESELFPFQKLIVLDGGIEMVSHEDIQEELALVQSELHFQSVYIKKFDLTEFSNRITVYCGEPQLYAFEHRAIQKLLQRYKELGLTLHIHIDYETVKTCYDDLSIFYVKFQRFLEELEGFIDTAYARQTRFEFGCKNAVECDAFLEFVHNMRILLEDAFPKSYGIALSEWMCAEEKQEYLKCLWKEKISFVGVRLCLPLVSGGLEEGLETYQSEFFQREINTIRKTMKILGTEEMPIYLVQWNTLGGITDMEAGTFFRSAILLHTLRMLGKHVSGVGFPCQTFVEDFSFAYPSLFAYAKIKRPIYFVLDVVQRLRGEVVFDNGEVLVTKSAKHRWTIAMMSPRYVQPSFSIDRYFIEHEITERNISLMNLENGDWWVKRLIYEKDRSGIFERMQEVGLAHFGDADVLNCLEHVIYPDLRIYKQQVQENHLQLHADIPFNGIVLFEISRCYGYNGDNNK